MYAQPDRFEREWAITGTFPFFRKRTHVQPGKLREVSDAQPADVQRLAKLVVTRLVVPDDGVDDEEVLRKTVELVSRDDVARRRADYQAVIAKFNATGLRDETIVGEIEDLLAAFNAAVKSHTNAQRSRAALQVVTATEETLGLMVPLVSVTSDITTALGEAYIERRWNPAPVPDLPAVSLLAEAQRALTD